MTLLNTINVGGTNYGITGAAVLGSCATPAGSEVKVCTFSDNFELKAGDMLLIKFTYANTYGDGSTTYPKLQINGTNYVMRRADGNYLQSGEWGNNATLTFLFDGTDFILPAGSGSAKGSGVPLGAILAIHSNQVPDGYLPCNGVQFDTAQFAALYALLGSDRTPDLREATLRGIGHNGTYVFDSTETDPSTGLAGTQNHDEYTLGEFKDDCLQDHKHKLNIRNSAGAPGGDPNVYNGSPTAGLSGSNTGTALDPSSSQTVRKGTVTRGKSVGENYIIKATSGLSDDQQDYVLNQINTQRSYSTTEHPTGRKWIDGKPTYEITLEGTITATEMDFNHNIANIDSLVTVTPFMIAGSGDSINPSFYVSASYFFTGYATKTQLKIRTTAVYVNTQKYRIILEYTKTTD